jgi:uncharacterized membrane protein
MDMTSLQKSKKFSWQWVLTGSAIILFIFWLSLTPEGLLGKADAVGYAVCHRIPERSFLIGDRQMPMCARCTGLFLGAMLGLLSQLAQGRKGKMPPIPAAILFGIFALAWVMDGINSFTMLMPKLPSLYQTQNWTRLVTGTGMGLAISAILLPAFFQTMFKEWGAASGFGKWYKFLAVLTMAAILDTLVLLEISWLNYIFGLISAASVFVLLTLIYCMVLVMLFKKENTFDNLKQLVIPLIGGFIIGLIQIGVIDLVRYLLTGTWITRL